MLKYSVAIAALLLGAPVAFAQGAGDKTGGGAGMSNSGPKLIRTKLIRDTFIWTKLIRLEVWWWIAAGAFGRVVRCKRRGFGFGFVRL